jgi:hypothetical protein
LGSLNPPSFPTFDFFVRWLRFLVFTSFEELKSKNQAAHYFKNQKESEDEEQAVLTAYVGKLSLYSKLC